MNLTKLSINRPLTILMFVLVLVIMGWVAFTQLRVDRMPNISSNFVSVNASYTGASPEDIEALIIQPLERRVAGLPGIASVTSNANSGSGSINISLAEGADADKALLDVDRRLSSARSSLPSDASLPSANKMDPNAMPLMNISLAGPLPLDLLYDLATETVQPRLQSVLGVADVSVSGGQQREVRVFLDYARMDGYGLTVSQITQAINRENLDQPGGTVSDGRQQVNVRSVGKLQSSQDLSDLIVTTTPTGPIFLRDIATIKDGFKDRTRIQRTNGQEAVGLSIIKQSDANSIQVAENIQKELTRLRPKLPAGVEILVTNDSSRFTRQALDAVNKDLVMAVFLTALVLLLFLHGLRNVVIVIVAIPTSLISTFLVMMALGVTLNTISLMALAMSIGILVDDSIVVLENIHRHLKLGEMPRLAALTGRNEIGLAAIAITLTDIVVYLPLAVMQQGNILRLFREYGLTIAAATLFSLLISFTLTPMLASRWLKATEGQGRGFWSRFSLAWEKGFDRVSGAYGKVLGRSLRVRPLVVLMGLVAVGAAVAMIQFRIVPTEYAPQEDDNQFSVSVQLPAGSTLQKADAATTQVEAFILAQVPDEVQAMFTTVSGGGGGGGFGGPGGGRASGNISVQLVDKDHRQRSVFEIVNVVRRISTTIPDATVRVNVQGSMPGGGGGGGGGVQVRITGAELEKLREIATDIEEAMRATPGIVDVNNGTSAGNPEIRAVFDRKRMAELGVTGQQVATSIRTLMGGASVGQIRPPDAIQRDITVIGADSDRLDIANVPNIPVATSGGTAVRLGQVATLVRATGPVQITRTDGQRTVSLSATVSGRSLGDVARDLRENVARVAIPGGYTATVAGGQVAQLELAFSALLAALALSVILIYMLMVALYESFLDPLTIMFSLPVSLVGAFGGLWLTGSTLNIFSMIGLIMLMGLVAKNAILLVDYTKTLRRRGLQRHDALIEAGRTRLRPIVMTTMTVVCAMIPLALKLEAGAESRAPMAIVLIGGVLSSTLLTLLLVPTVYSYLDDLQNLMGGLRVPKLLVRRSGSATPAESVKMRPEHVLTGAEGQEMA